MADGIYRSHYKYGIGGVKEEKRCFETEKDALLAAFKINSKPQTIHKVVAYKCAKCQKWHIGRNTTELTEEDKQEYKKKIEKYERTGICY